jgi:hypothetical protein
MEPDLRQHAATEKASFGETPDERHDAMGGPAQAALQGIDGYGMHDNGGLSMSMMNGVAILSDELDALAEAVPAATPEMRREIVLAMLRASQEPAEQEPQPETTQQADKPKLPRVVFQKRWDIRLRDYLLVQVTQPRRIVRWLAWWIALPWKAASFARVATGGQVGPLFIEEDGIPRVLSPAERIAERDNVCEACEQRYYFVRLDGETTEHCQACKCPPTRWSENEYRNTLASWHCPLRKHAGPYPNDGQAGALKGLGYEENAVLAAFGGGCTGCGCGKAKA